jgi:glycosyltransferase involved in cell wall biosynthesis
MQVALIYVGPIQVMARLFKTIDTIRAAGHECHLIHGWTEQKMPDYREMKIPVYPIRVVQDRWKPLTFLSQLIFGWRAGMVTATLRPSSVICVGMTTLLSGIVAKRRLGQSVTFVYDSTELGLDMHESRLKRLLWRPIYLRGLRRADVIIHASEERLRLMRDKYNPPGRHCVVCNYPRYRPRFSTPPPLPPLRVVYLGILMRERFCVEMLKAFSDTDDPTVHFDLIVFYGKQKYREDVEKASARPTRTHIRVLPPVPQNQVLDRLSEYHIGIAFYGMNNPNEYYCAPNKLYDYISAGVAVLGSSQPALKNVIEPNKIGVCLDEITPDTIRNGIERIRSGRLWNNITEEMRRRYCWESQENIWRTAIEPVRP